MAHIVRKNNTCNTCTNPNCEHGTYYILRDSKGNYLESLGRDGNLKQSKIDEVVSKGLVSEEEMNKKIRDKKPKFNKPDFDSYTVDDIYSIKDMLFENMDDELYEPYKITVNYHTEYEGNNNHLNIYIRGADEVDELEKISISESTSYDYFKVDGENKIDLTSEKKELEVIFDEVTSTLKKNYDYVQRKSKEYEIEDVEDIIWNYGSVENMKQYKRYEIKNNIEDIDTGILDELNITNDDIEYDYDFDKVPRLNYKARDKLNEKFGSLKNVSEEDREKIESIDGIGKTTADKVVKWSSEVEDIPDKKVDDDKTIEATQQLKEESLERGVVDVIKESNRLKRSGGRHNWKDNGKKIIKLDKDNVKTGMIRDPNGRSTRSFVLAHEIGHAIESNSYTDPDSEYRRETGDFVKNMSEEAKFETQFLHKFIVGDNRDNPQERFANIVGLLATEPKRTKEIAPNTVDAIEKLSNQIDGDSGDLLEKIVNEEYY